MLHTNLLFKVLKIYKSKHKKKKRTLAFYLMNFSVNSLLVKMLFHQNFNNKKINQKATNNNVYSKFTLVFCLKSIRTRKKPIKNTNKIKINIHQF